MTNLLSKSDYLLFLKHPAWLWLKKHQPEKLPPVSDSLQRTFTRGHDFESYAQQFFPEGVVLGFGNFTEYESLATRTKAELERGTKTIFQGRFEVENLTCIVDILHQVSDDTYELIEVKSSTQAKPEHLPDLAFQTIVLEKAGYHIQSISVMHVNKNYVREGAIFADQLITRTDVTTEVRAVIPETMMGVDQALRVANQSQIPDISPRFANNGALKEWLEIFLNLKPDLPDYNIYQLAGKSVAQIAALEDQGIVSLQEIPGDFKLSPKQQAQVFCIKTSQRIIKPEPIKAFIESLSYPLYFFDYETLGDLIPPFDGMKPYQQIPFQYSLHVIREPEAKTEHYEFLSQDDTNPASSLTKQLQAQIGNEGTVLVWYEGFEKHINLIMADMVPDARDFYIHLNEHIKDLMLPFASGWLVDGDFFGSASIKKVQPVLAPDLHYKGLTIGNGEAAQRIWMETFLEHKNQDQKEQIISDLLTYCKYDTLVMVRIFEFLKKCCE
jgi:hypothetical protein